MAGCKIKPEYFFIRPHHFLCLPGYKGVGYNPTHSNSWDLVSQAIKENPQIKVKLVEDKDTLCFKCPNSDKGCNESFVKQLDSKVKALLGLEAGKFYTYSEIAQKLKQLLNPQKHAQICGDCGWRKKGLCVDTFEKGKD